MKKNGTKQEMVKILRKVALKNNHSELGKIREIKDGYVSEDLNHSTQFCDDCRNGFYYVSITKKGKEFLRKNDTKGKKLLIRLLEDIMIALVKSKVIVELSKEERDFLNDYGVKTSFNLPNGTFTLLDGDFKRHIAKLMHLLFNENEYCEVE